MKELLSPLFVIKTLKIIVFYEIYKVLCRFQASQKQPASRYLQDSDQKTLFNS